MIDVMKVRMHIGYPYEIGIVLVLTMYYKQSIQQNMYDRSPALRSRQQLATM